MNWKVRIKNRNWWLAFIPAVLLLVQVIAAPFGYSFEIGALNEQAVGIINAIFAVLVLLGVVNDPTTEGFGDSERAMTYEVPYPKKVDDGTEDQ